MLAPPCDTVSIAQHGSLRTLVEPWGRSDLDDRHQAKVQHRLEALQCPLGPGALTVEGIGWHRRATQDHRLVEVGVAAQPLHVVRRIMDHAERGGRTMLLLLLDLEKAFD